MPSKRALQFMFLITATLLLASSCGPGGAALFDAVAFLQFNRRLADRWAPIHSQDVDVTGGSSIQGKADFITNINFDGEWDTLNNWENTSNYPLRAYVYYSVVATRTHWFILYAFYHPRDWYDDVPIVESLESHENDLEGFLAIVKRPPTFSNDNLGELLGIVTVCHNHFYSYTPSGSPLTDGDEDIDGTVNMQTFEGHAHPRTAQTAKSHCLKVPPHVRIRGGDGIKYFPKGIAQQPGSANDRDVGYQLVNIFDGDGLWGHRHNSQTFHSYGVFRGNNGVDNKAKAPWKWDDSDDGPELLGGELAVDPVKLVQIYFNGLGPFSQTYTYNGYEGISSTWPDVE